MIPKEAKQAQTLAEEVLDGSIMGSICVFGGGTLSSLFLYNVYLI